MAERRNPKTPQGIYIPIRVDQNFNRIGSSNRRDPAISRTLVAV
jgi:hypothetical protein